MTSAATRILRRAATSRSPACRGAVHVRGGARAVHEARQGGAPRQVQPPGRRRGLSLAAGRERVEGDGSRTRHPRAKAAAPRTAGAAAPLLETIGSTRPAAAAALAAVAASPSGRARRRRSLTSAAGASRLRAPRRVLADGRLPTRPPKEVIGAKVARAGYRAPGEALGAWRELPGLRGRTPRPAPMVWKRPAALLKCVFIFDTLHRPPASPPRSIRTSASTAHAFFEHSSTLS